MKYFRKIGVVNFAGTYCKVLYLARILLDRKKKKKLTKKFENLKTGVRNQPFFLYISAVSQFRGYIRLVVNNRLCDFFYVAPNRLTADMYRPNFDF